MGLFILLTLYSGLGLALLGILAFLAGSILQFFVVLQWAAVQFYFSKSALVPVFCFALLLQEMLPPEYQFPALLKNRKSGNQYQLYRLQDGTSENGGTQSFLLQIVWSSRLPVPMRKQYLL